MKEKAALKDVVSVYQPKCSLFRRLRELTHTTKVDLDDCADAFVATAKNGSMTGRSIVIGKKPNLCSKLFVADDPDAGLYI